MHIMSSNSTIGCDSTLKSPVLFLAVKIKKFEMIERLILKRVLIVNKLSRCLDQHIFLHE